MLFRSQLPELADKLLAYCEPRKINLSLPSLRADNFSRELMMKVQKVRKSGLTFAPEAGTQRLRDAINKNVTEEEILTTCRTAFSGGWNSVKLYFMLGLPTETDEDVIGIAELAYKIIQEWKANAVYSLQFLPSGYQLTAQMKRTKYLCLIILLFGMRILSFQCQEHRKTETWTFQIYC